MEKGEIDYLAQLISVLEKVELQLETAYKNKNQAHVEEIKKYILNIQGKISEVLK